MPTEEAERLHKKLQHAGWTIEDCKRIAPLTLEINKLKKEQDAIILAHTYQTPDIIFSVADYVGDSYGLSVKATKSKAKKIIFCSVLFMGEIAKLLNPEKEVIMPVVAGCSLADSITPEDVRALRKKHPNAGVVCYVNTTAAVKAESDACCTSANAAKIIEAMPQNEIIFIPDEFMGKNFQNSTSKNIILWNGRCIVHEKFAALVIDQTRKRYPDVKVLAHPECSPEVIKKVDYAGGTAGMVKYIGNSKDKRFLVLTECGLVDRMRVEHPDKEFVGVCNVCPYMKEITLKDILKALKNPSREQIVEIPEDIAIRARKALDKMYELEKG